MNEFSLKRVFNWQVASKPLVKKYVADLYQSGITAPVVTELFNDTEVAFTYEYIAPGYYIVISNKPIFTGCTMGCPNGQKVQVTVSNSTYIDNVGGPSGYSISAFPAAEDVIVILTSNLSTVDDDILGSFLQNTLEITVYP